MVKDTVSCSVYWEQNYCFHLPIWWTKLLVLWINPQGGMSWRMLGPQCTRLHTESYPGSQSAGTRLALYQRELFGASAPRSAATVVPSWAHCRKWGVAKKKRTKNEKKWGVAEKNERKNERKMSFLISLNNIIWATSIERAMLIEYSLHVGHFPPSPFSPPTCLVCLNWTGNVNWIFSSCEPISPFSLLSSYLSGLLHGTRFH